MTENEREPGSREPAADLLRRAREGEEAALGRLLELHRGRLEAAVACRMSPGIRGRVDPADIVQEGFLTAVRAFPRFDGPDGFALYAWLRGIVLRRLQDAHRFHLDAGARNARRELSLGWGKTPSASSDVLAARLIAETTSPSEAAIRAERQSYLQAALERLADVDREVLALKYFEGMSNAEVGATLGMSEDAARKRRARSLLRLKELLAGA